jgi:hypothetical protein
MRTPLTAPAFDAAPAGTLANQNLTPSANGPRRARVSSLPSVKTPTVEQQPPQFITKENGVEANNAFSPRTTLSGLTGEDLRLYQAAVLARKPLMTLKLVPRKGRRDSRVSPQVPARVFTKAPFTGGLKLDLSEPQSASSLAHAFGKSDQPASTARVFVAGHRSASATEDANVAREGLVPDKDGLRSSFKRLLSQTLGPASSKRTQLSHAGNHDVDEDNNTTRVSFVVGRWSASATEDANVAREIRHISAPEESNSGLAEHGPVLRQLGEPHSTEDVTGISQSVVDGYVNLLCGRVFILAHWNTE